MTTSNAPRQDHGLPPHMTPDDDVWMPRALAELADRELVEAVIAAISPPRSTASSSFVLHAPLELAARAQLLPMVTPAMRPMARQRIAEIAARYVRSSPAAAFPERVFENPAHAFTQFFAALEAKDVDSADAAITHLAASTSVAEIRNRLVDAIAPLLSAAGHAPILTAALPLLDKQFSGAKALLRAPVRALVRASDVRVSWHLAPRTSPRFTNAEERLMTALANAPRAPSTSDSIAPTVLAVELSGDAPRILGPLVGSLTITEARRVLLRAAAWSMLQDDPEHAPYGWTHCLTLPQALLQNADASRDHQALIAIAATEVLGMRATLGTTNLDAGKPLPAALSTVPSIEALVSFGATHPDAHVAKYTLACLQAAEDDRDVAPLFLCAANVLHNWWRKNDPQPVD